jgi:transposase
VADSASSLPLYFRYLPGNIVDVSSLCVTVEELARLGIPRSFVLIDAGLFSEENIRELYEKRIDFLTRLPSSRKIYKRLIKEGARTLESFENAVRYGKRALFITHKAIDLYGKEAYAYIILDP